MKILNITELDREESRGKLKRSKMTCHNGEEGMNDRKNERMNE